METPTKRCGQAKEKRQRIEEYLSNLDLEHVNRITIGRYIRNALLRAKGDGFRELGLLTGKSERLRMVTHLIEAGETS
jgi:hypothetical protein